MLWKLTKEQARRMETAETGNRMMDHRSNEDIREGLGISDINTTKKLPVNSDRKI
jgi:hypothetical protein